jgi:hypothetical protein
MEHQAYEGSEEVAMHVMTIDEVIRPARMERRALRCPGARGCSLPFGGWPQVGRRSVSVSVSISIQAARGEREHGER